MDQFEREDSSKYAQPSRQEPFEPAKQEESAVQPPVQEPAKPKKSKAPLILAVLLVLALLGMAVFGWLWYQQNGEVDSVRSDLSTARNKIAQLESAAEANSAIDEESDVTTDTKDADSEAVVKAALAYMLAPVQPLGSNSREAKVEYLEDGFAKVIVTTSDVSPSGTSASKLSFALTMKESNDDWIVLSAAEGPVANMDELMKEYGIPREAF